VAPGEHGEKGDEEGKKGFLVMGVPRAGGTASVRGPKWGGEGYKIQKVKKKGGGQKKG